MSELDDLAECKIDDCEEYHCSSCDRHFTEENEQYTDDDKLCFECWVDDY